MENIFTLPHYRQMDLCVKNDMFQFHIKSLDHPPLWMIPYQSIDVFPRSNKQLPVNTKTGCDTHIILLEYHTIWQKHKHTWCKWRMDTNAHLQYSDSRGNHWSFYFHIVYKFALFNFLNVLWYGALLQSPNTFHTYKLSEENPVIRPVKCPFEKFLNVI